MPDDKTKSRPQDAKRINVNEAYELRDWAKKFGVSEEELKAAVKQVGTSAEAVEKHLEARHTEWNSHASFSLRPYILRSGWM